MNQDNQQVQRTRSILIFTCAAMALVLLIAATQVEMPLRAVLIAIAFSEIVVLILVMMDKILPNKRR